MYVYGGASGAPNLAATVTASSVNSGGATATFPLPSSLPQGGYFFVTENMGSAGNYEFNSWNLYSIASSQTIAGNPFGVAVGALTVNTNVCAPYMGCTSTTINETFPIVSLYSNNQVLIGNGPINVGLNPTAVLTYASPPESYTNSSISYGVAATITVTGAMRAVAANSGSNSISILDILHGTLLFNVTVGNQPVALAVSSDGSTAYVANYTDGTVTQVNLITGTVTATVAVGGQPTAISLTAAGTLWVGGAGFLTEMNASPMSVVATKPVANKSIVALGFSDSENQLVATTVDTSGNVYADEISPSTFAAGRSYTPLASSMISSLGTHLNRANTEVRAFTATLASSSLANANLVGAPPLVVQDGWAVVTATPTGFSITDITGHIVLVSETTPSPVTAIAVNSKLNVAYLVMPDSNILLTVPLPGTN
jgi:YVTN family beta-propeller protein